MVKFVLLFIIYLLDSRTGLTYSPSFHATKHNQCGQITWDQCRTYRVHFFSSFVTSMNLMYKYGLYYSMFSGRICHYEPVLSNEPVLNSLVSVWNGFAVPLIVHIFQVMLDWFVVMLHFPSNCNVRRNYMFLIVYKNALIYCTNFPHFKQLQIM